MTVEEADVRTNMLLSGENGFRLGPTNFTIRRSDECQIIIRRNMQKRIWGKNENSDSGFKLCHKDQNITTNSFYLLCTTVSCCLSMEKQIILF